MITRKHIPPFIILFLPIIVLASFWIGKPTPQIYLTGYIVPTNVIYSIGLAILVLIISGGMGNRILILFKGLEWSQAERALISLMVGLGTLAYLVFVFGIFGWLSPAYLIILIILATLISLPFSLNILKTIPSSISQMYCTWKSFRIDRRILAAIGMFILVLTLLITLTPPFDYDSLAYHLQGPRLFLDAGKIYPNFENWFTLFPFTWEMLYMLGLGLGSDIFAKLIHFSTFILFVLSAYTFGRRLISSSAGWIAAAILMGIPILPLWGATAYTDLAWALFQFLAIGLVAIWQKEGKTGYLLLAGMMQGWSMGSKYPALAAGAAIGVIVLLISLKQKSASPAWKRILTSGVVFGGAALLVASPWYIKNYLWTGDPVFPLLIPPTKIDPLRVELWKQYINSFGVGREWYHYLLLPIQIFTQYEKFGTYMGAVDMPSPIFFIVFAYPWARRKFEQPIRAILDYLILTCVLLFAIWAASSQQTRFLLQIYPVLAIISSLCVLWIKDFDKKFPLRKSIAFAFVGATILEALFIISISWRQLMPLKVQLGIESYPGFLSRTLNDYDALSYINQNTDQNERAFLLWDGRGYYCSNCLADIDQHYWVFLSNQCKIDEILRILYHKNIYYILLVNNDRDFFVEGHDPYGLHFIGVQVIDRITDLSCVSSIFKDRDSEIYNLSNCY